MIVTPIQTERITPKSTSLAELINISIDTLAEHQIVVITSKIVSICEGNIVSQASTTKDQLIDSQAELRLPRSTSSYGLAFTITNGMLIPSAGIDESNAGGDFVLWPKDAQQTANDIREQLCRKFDLSYVGVIITDSTCQPMRRGTIGVTLAHSGFASLHDYTGQIDLFGRPFNTSQSNVASGLAAAAVVTMGEGAEQTPVCLIEDVPFVQFQDRNPTEIELSELRLSISNDLFAPFLQAVDWQPADKVARQDSNMP